MTRSGGSHPASCLRRPPPPQPRCWGGLGTCESTRAANRNQELRDGLGIRHVPSRKRGRTELRAPCSPGPSPRKHRQRARVANASLPGRRRRRRAQSQLLVPERLTPRTPGRLLLLQQLPSHRRCLRRQALERRRRQGEAQAPAPPPGRTPAK